MNTHTFFQFVFILDGEWVAVFEGKDNDIRLLGILLYTVPMSQESSDIMSLFQVLPNKAL